jgi:transcription elongation factor Elf1
MAREALRMDITFNCDRCGQSLTIDEAGAGLVLQCPSCGKEITIPSKPVWLRAVNDVLRKNVQMILEGRNNPGETRLAIQKVLRETCYQAEPGDEGTPADFRQFERQNLVIESNVAAAGGYRQAVQANDPDLVDEFPALELVRGGYREHHRGDPCHQSGTPGAIGWTERWQEAAEKSGDADACRAFEKSGRMVALKSSGIWQLLGTLWGDSIGNPYPPFAWDSSMWTEEVDRDDAGSLGLIGLHDAAKPRRGLTPPQFIPIEDERMTEWLQNQPGKCDHCGEAKPSRLLTVCETCEEAMCPDCKSKGCAGPSQPEPRNAFDCFNQASDEMTGETGETEGEPSPLRKEVAERVLSLCNRAFEFGFAEKYHYAISRTHRMRGEALESLGRKEEALREYELAMEQDPKVGLKKRIAALRKQ